MDFSRSKLERPPAARSGFWRSPWIRLLIAGGAVIGLVLFLYAEQNHHGKAAWQKHKRALEAKGEILDWLAYVPEPIPAAENIFAAPLMRDAFVKGGSGALMRQFNPSFPTAQRPLWRAAPVAELTVVLPDQALPNQEPDVALYYEAPKLSLGAGRESGSPPPVIPLIVMEEVPLTDAIRHLAKQAGIKYTLDPEILPHDKGNPALQSTVSFRWEDVTARHALKEILKNYQLALIETTNGRPAHIIRQDPARPKVFSDPDTRQKIAALAGQALHPLTEARSGVTLNGSQGYTFFKAPMAPFKPFRILVRAETMPDREELAAFFPAATVSGQHGDAGPFEIKPTGSNTFRATISPRLLDAGEYLDWSDQFEPAFDLMRESLKRPSARIDGNYERPFQMPLQNYVSIRLLAQTLAQRAQCSLLLDEPEDALGAITLLHDLRKLLEPARSTNALTLVAAMINVAVRGIYEDAIADGLRLHAWKEPQLRAIEKQLGEVDLLPLVAQSLRAERAAMCRTIEMTSPSQITSLFSFAGPRSLTQRMRDPQFWILTAAPHGWIYDNMVTISSVNQSMLDNFDPKNGTIRPRGFDDAACAIEKRLSHWSPANFLAAIAIPNYTRAWQVAASNQDKARQALLACALERYYLVHKRYPETLAALVPEYLAQLPVDVITGESFMYKLPAGDRFLLYSVGWNEKDDGGIVARSKAGNVEPYKGDWVWQPDQAGGS